MAGVIIVGNPRFMNDEITIQLSGILDLVTVDELERQLEALLRPPGVILDCSTLVIHGDGVMRLMAIQQNHRSCHIKLTHVNPEFRSAFDCRMASKAGIQIEYANPKTV